MSEMFKLRDLATKWKPAHWAVGEIVRLETALLVSNDELQAKTEECAELQTLLIQAHAALTAHVAMLERSQAREKELELSHFMLRIRAFGINHSGKDHTTNCTIWGDDGQGNLSDGTPVSGSCSCGALWNFSKDKIHELEAELARVRAQNEVLQTGLDCVHATGCGGGEQRCRFLDGCVRVAAKSRRQDSLLVGNRVADSLRFANGAAIDVSRPRLS